MAAMAYFEKLFYTTATLKPQIYLVHGELPREHLINLSIPRFEYNFILNIFFLFLSPPFINTATIIYSAQIRTIKRFPKSMYLADLCPESAIHINVQYRINHR